MFEDIVVKKEKELRAKNLNELRENLDSSDNTFKIQNYAEKFGFQRKK